VLRRRAYPMRIEEALAGSGDGLGTLARFPPSTFTFDIAGFSNRQSIDPQGLFSALSHVKYREGGALQERGRCLQTQSPSSVVASVPLENFF
jgi:hypothetical protein